LVEDELPDKPMKIDAALRELNSKPLINLWPTAAVILDVSRSEAHEAKSRCFRSDDSRRPSVRRCAES
jgi:hypothetical protein